MTTRPSDTDGWYDPDKPAPVPEGMETTAEERARAKSWSAKHGADWVDYLLRDLDRALAEIARLTAINADLLKTNLSHAEALARLAELEAERDRWLLNGGDDARQAAVLAEREACHDIALAIDSGRGNEKQIAAAIRARPAP